MSMSYIRRTYGVPAKRGGRVVIPSYLDTPGGRITGSRHGHLIVRIDGDRRSTLWHPNEIGYYQEDGSVLWPKP